MNHGFPLTNVPLGLLLYKSVARTNVRAAPQLPWILQNIPLDGARVGGSNAVSFRPFD